MELDGDGLLKEPVGGAQQSERDECDRDCGFVYVAGYDGVVVLTSGKYSESRLITEGCSELLLSELDRVF